MCHHWPHPKKMPWAGVIAPASFMGRMLSAHQGIGSGLEELSQLLGNHSGGGSPLCLTSPGVRRYNFSRASRSSADAGRSELIRILKTRSAPDGPSP